MTRAVAASAVREARRFVEIDELVVAADARDLGVGRRLIGSAKAWACERNIPGIEVSAWSFNLKTIAFYKRIGFMPTVARFAMTAE